MRLVIVAAAAALLAGCYTPPPPPPPGQPIVWSNPEGKTAGTATPQPANQGDQCREYQTTITIAGRPQAAWGIACRQADGSWRLVN
jgi:surface antigen